MLILDFPEDGAELKGPEGEEVPSELNGESIKEMENLKTLIIRNGNFSKVPTHFPRRLRVLKWSGYPSSSLPQYFHPQLLSILELPESSFKQCEPILVSAYLCILLHLNFYDYSFFSFFLSLFYFLFFIIIADVAIFDSFGFQL